MAVGDWLGTVLLAWATAYGTGTSFLYNLAIWFVVGEIMHWYFGSQTAFLTIAGIETNC